MSKVQRIVIGALFVCLLCPGVFSQTHRKAPTPAPAQPVSREALAERFRLFLNRILPDFNFIETKVVEMNTWPRPLPPGECDYYLVATHSHFTSGSFDVGPLAHQVYRWVDANRSDLRHLGFCSADLQNDGNLGYVGYFVDKDAASRRKDEASRREEAAALKRNLLSEIKDRESRVCPDMEYLRDRAKNALSEMERNLPKWDEMLKKREIFRQAYDNHVMSIEQKRQEVIDWAEKAKTCRSEIQEKRTKLKEVFGLDPAPAEPPYPRPVQPTP
jgi:hypothetical protein